MYNCSEAAAVLSRRRHRIGGASNTPAVTWDRTRHISERCWSGVTTRSANGAMFSSGTTVSVVRMHVHPIAIASTSLSRGDDAFDNARHEGVLGDGIIGGYPVHG